MIEFIKIIKKLKHKLNSPPKPLSKSSRNNHLHSESRWRWEYGCKLILNGLAREARNRKRVGAYGGPARYQLGAYVGMQ